jgi:hypothetical protein
VAEAWGQFGNHEEGEHLLLEAWKLLWNTGTEDLIVDTSVCV